MHIVYSRNYWLREFNTRSGDRKNLVRNSKQQNHNAFSVPKLIVFHENSLVMKFIKRFASKTWKKSTPFQSLKKFNHQNFPDLWTSIKWLLP